MVLFGYSRSADSGASSAPDLPNYLQQPDLDRAAGGTPKLSGEQETGGDEESLDAARNSVGPDVAHNNEGATKTAVTAPPYLDRGNAALEEQKILPVLQERPLALDCSDWQVDACLLDIWNFGVGLVTFIRYVDVAEQETWEGLRRSLTSLDTKRAYMKRAADAVSTMTSATGPPPNGAGNFDLDGAGEPLWAQQLLIVEARHHAEFKSLDAAACTLTSNGELLKEPKRSYDTSLRVGIEVCIAHNPEALPLRGSVARVVAAQTAVWAAAIELDRLLDNLLQRDGSELRRISSLGELEDRSLKLLDMFEYVQRFRNNVEAIPIHLGIPEKTVWMCINKEWLIDKQLLSLDKDLNAVEHVYGHLINIMTTRQARFLNNVVLAVTMLSLATFLVTAWDFTHKRFDPFSLVSEAVALVSLIFSGLRFFVVRRLSSGIGSKML